MNIFVIVFGLLLNSATCSKLDDSSLCMKKVAAKYFKHKDVLIIHWTSKVKQERKFFSEATDLETTVYGTFYNTDKWTVKTLQNDSSFGKEKTDIWNLVIILDLESVNNPDYFRKQLEMGKKNLLWSAKSRTIIMIKDIALGDGQEAARKLIKVLWEVRKGYNTLVMIADQGKHSFFRWYPYSEDCTEVKRVQVINECQQGKFLNLSELFSNDVGTNLNGCYLHAGTFPCPPYVMHPEIPNKFTEGVDIRVINTLAKYFNFRINYVPLPPGVSPFTVLTPEGRPVGFNQMLYDQTLDLFFSGIRLNFDRNKVADFLESYLQDAIVWVTLSPSKIASWKSIVDPFSKELWVATFMSCLVIAFTIYLISNVHRDSIKENTVFRKFASSTLVTWGMMLSIAVPHPKTQFLRMFMLTFAIFSLHITTQYTSTLITILTSTRYTKSFKSPMEALDAGVKTYLFSSARSTYNMSDFKLWNRILQPGKHVFSDDYIGALRRIAQGESAMVMMAKFPAMYEISTRFSTQHRQPKAKIIDKTHNLYQVSMYASMGHPMADHFRRKTKQLVESGLVYYWLREILSHSAKETIDETETSQKRAFTVGHIEGAFFIIIVGLIMSFLVFCVELMYSKINFHLHISKKCNFLYILNLKEIKLKK